MSTHLCPHHCPQGSGPGAGLAIITALVILTIATVSTSAFRHGADRLVTDVVTVIMITAFSLAGLAALAAGIALAVVVRRRARSRAALPAYRVTVIPPQVRTRTRLRAADSRAEPSVTAGVRQPRPALPVAHRAAQPGAVRQPAARPGSGTRQTR